MKRKQIVYFLIIVLVPSALLIFFGHRFEQVEQAKVRERIHQLQIGGLNDVESLLSARIKQLEIEFLKSLGELSGADSDDSLRVLQNGDRFARQVFRLDSQGRLVYPNVMAYPSESARAFLDRTRSVWDFGALGSHSKGASEDARPAHGWHSWFWNEGLQLIFWSDTASGILGVELERAALIAELIAELSKVERSEMNQEIYRIGLLGVGGNTLHQWGSYQGMDGEAPLASVGLSAPLQAWSLNYYAPSASSAKAGVRFGFPFYAALGLTVGALLWMARAFYREQASLLKEAEQKVSFVNQVSHELKTPLTNIRLYAELLESEPSIQKDEAASRRLSVVVNETQRLSRLIHNVLTFSNNRNGRLRPQAGSFNPDDQIRKSLDYSRPSLERLGVKVECDLKAPDEFLGDADFLDQIMGNLIGNVEKYAASGGYLSVASRREGTGLIVRVGDRGPGVDGRERTAVFRPFYRVRNCMNEGVSGTGIGLSISRDLARLHGGDLIMETSSEGAVFKLVLNELAKPI